MNQTCFHCDLELNSNNQYQLDLLGECRKFCCPGCLAIAQTICDNNLEDFYRFRTEKNNTASEIVPQELMEIEALDNPAILEPLLSEQDKTSKQSDQDQQIILGVEGISCAACGWLIREQISKRPEVSSIQVNITTRRATIRFNKDAPLSPIIKQIRNLGYRAFPFSEDQQEKTINMEDRVYIKRLIVAGLGMMQIMMYATGLYIGEFQDMSPEHAQFLHLVSAILATPVVFYSAQPFYKSAWQSLIHRQLGMNLPVSIAIFSGYFASLFSLLSGRDVFYFDSVVMFTFFLLIGRFLEHRMRLKAILKQQNFRKLLPLSITKRNIDGTTSLIPVNDVKAGDQLIINAGAIVPVDGILIDPSAELNEAILTGEFIPVSKQKNDLLVSGSTNNSAGFIMQATSSAQNSRLQKLIQLQNNTDNLTSTRITLVDKVASWYIFGLLFLCLITGISWWYIQPQQVFPVVLSLLVVSCPCALSLATPAAIAAGISQLTDKGLMLRDAEALASLSKIDNIYFDKTGTLTLGKMSLNQTLTYSEFTQQQCLQIAFSLENISNHPVAEAFKHLHLKPLKLTTCQEVIAGGIYGTIGSENFRLGKPEFVTSDQKQLNLFCSQEENDPTARVILYLTRNEQHIATFILSDKLNPTALEAVRELKDDNKNIVMLSGDSQAACNPIASSLGIKQINANATPESKLSIIKDGLKRGENLLMVGDGVNDIGALSQANVSFTMGDASHLSQAASSAVLVSHDLTVIPQAISIAKKLERIIKQNISWAVIYNLTAIPFAALGLVPAWLAAIGMTLSSLIVVLNALRLRL